MKGIATKAKGFSRASPGSCTSVVPTPYDALARWKTEAPHLREFCESPLTDSNCRPPPYHRLSNGSQPRATVFLAVCALSAAVPFATDCHRLQPLGSINATSFVVWSDYGRPRHSLSHSVRHATGCLRRLRQLLQAGPRSPCRQRQAVHRPASVRNVAAIAYAALASADLTSTNMTWTSPASSSQL